MRETTQTYLVIFAEEIQCYISQILLVIPSQFYERAEILDLIYIMKVNTITAHDELI